MQECSELRGLDRVPLDLIEHVDLEKGLMSAYISTLNNVDFSLDTGQIVLSTGFPCLENAWSSLFLSRHLIG